MGASSSSKEKRNVKRIDLKSADEVKPEEGQPRKKYVVPRTKKQQKAFEKNRANTAKKFPKYAQSNMPEVSTKKKIDIKLEVSSPVVSDTKVAPRRTTPSPSFLYPPPQDASQLELHKPKSGIFVNESEKPDGDRDYDSFDLVYSRSPRSERPEERRRRKRKQKGKTLENIQEEPAGTVKKVKKQEANKKEPESTQERETQELLLMMEELANDPGEDMDTYLTKQFRRKVSQISKATSYQSKDIQTIESKDLFEEPAVSKYVQKFRRDSEAKRFEPVKRKFKRGTLESHSFTKLHQPTLKDFFFGSKEGTMHQGNENFPPSVRNNQGICMPVAAYCYSVLKHPNKWTSENIDEILEAGNNLMTQSIKKAHKHYGTKDLKPEHLQKYCIIGDKKIRFIVDEPEVSGFIRSDDKRVFNLSKGLNIFFARQSAGILKTQEMNIGIWKDKYFYMFDARPRTRDLFYSPNGTAMMANFYDVASLATVFLTRSNFGNWPFLIYPVKVIKVLKKDDLEAESQVEPDVRSNFNIINENKAVVLASFDLADKCFDFSRNKQSLAMAAVCLVYSRITPPSAWHRTTVDKIMIIGNQLYTECMECETFNELNIDSLPAIFTIGPYIVEIYIYANVYADLLYKKCCCTLLTCLETFFEKSTNGILQIEKYHLAVWKQRNMYYCFDPYSRDGEGFRCRDGTACTSMHTKISSLVEIITRNFDNKDAVFYFHALKVCKIQRDPIQSTKFPKHMTMDDFPVENFKNYKMKKSRKPATEKPVTVDYSTLAMKKLLAGEEPETSIFEIGSTVESLGVEQIPPMVHKHPSKSVLKKVKASNIDVIADLDSPSLSDTQIEPPVPEQPKLPEEIDFMDLDSFVLTQEEIELQEYDLGGEEGSGYVKYEQDYRAGGDIEGGKEVEDTSFADDDWFLARTGFTQVGEFSLPKDRSRISEQVNTDISFFPIHKEILYPTYIRGKQRMRNRLAYPKPTKGDGWTEYVPPEVEVTQSEELKKETNFKELPDGTQIVSGTKNISEFGKDIEFIAPFICIMAAVVSKKYGITTWTGEIVDYILKCGNELYRASKLRYDQVSKLEIPKITLGNTHFAVLVEYVFDTYIRQNILELAIEKIIFVRSDMGVMVTPTYACALLYKNHLYYLFDAFSNNEVGLSDGPANHGTACFIRFKDVHSLANRIMYNKSKREADEEVVYTRFVLSSVKVKTLHPSQEETAKKKKKGEPGTAKSEESEAQSSEGSPQRKKKSDKVEEESEEEIVTQDGKKRIRKRNAQNKVGYQNKDGLYIIEGTSQLTDRNSITDELKQDHFVCVCACLMLLTTPIQNWDTRKVDQVLDNGKHVYSHAEDLEISEKRTIKNMLINKHIFDIVIKQIKIENWRDKKKLAIALDTILKRKLSYFLIQLPNACYVIHKSQDGVFHVFDPYGYPGKGKANKAGWVRFKDSNKLRMGLKRLVKGGREHFSFYNFEVTSVKKAPKDVILSSKLEEYDFLYASRRERFGKPFYEDVEWLKIDPVPWSRKFNKSASGRERGKMDNMWQNWDIEYNKDLFSLIGNIHQSSDRFSEETRGKQTLANLAVAVGMTEIYNLSEWNSAVIDSILVNGDNYFTECIQDISDDDYELSIDDLKEECSIFPFFFMVTFTPVVEGTMFLVRVTQFNLYKALRYFFNQTDKRCGIICVTAGKRKRQVAFGKLHESEYFMFDCECMGPPMFLDRTGRAYALRTTTLNRLLHVLTLTLRGGDFFIFEVKISDMSSIA
ncbi:uncharacterized protein LOC108904110 [Anoplophora glabripennis]|uniref:uncharacterized protein LOC108904110 n=1 Tax=Anoplophora glabripennis TaxID=217634 RepID=UPI000C760A1E|nr:uncharacterized protein LOC108904110 [Anoplophora glabripennis]